MSKIEWKKEFNIGNEKIDAQHFIIVELINELNDVIDSESNMADRDVFEEIKRYARQHIHYEEHLMKKFKYPGYTNHH